MVLLTICLNDALMASVLYEGSSRAKQKQVGGDHVANCGPKKVVKGCHGIAIIFSMLLILLTEKHTLRLLKSAHQSTSNFFCRKVLLISGLEEVANVK